MDNITINASSAPERKIERSAAYPAITLQHAIAFTGEIYKNFRSSPTKRSDILKLIEGAHPRYIAASSYYLLLDRDGDVYKVSDFYIEIVNPISQAEQAKNLLLAFEAPKLNKNLIEKFDGGELPSELQAHLTRFFGITQDAAPLAAEVFLENAKYCGVLTDKNVLLFGTKKLRTDSNEGEGKKVESGEPAQQGPGGNAVTNPESPAVKQQPLLLEEMVNSDKVRIRLSGGKLAYLLHPLDLNKTDVAILLKEIEKLQLLVDSA
jgi:hypothetical protein